MKSLTDAADQLMDSVYFHSVAEFENGLRRGRTLSSSKARAFHGVIWTEEASAVEKLTTEWQKTGAESYRICDWSVYDAQIRRLLGLD